MDTDTDANGNGNAKLEPRRKHPREMVRYGTVRYVEKVPREW